ncbi:DUF202 domain-containing protein [Gordonia sp. CPCC 206044]
MSVDVVDEREPDYRFTLANERTFLAWVRTALGLSAAAAAAKTLAPWEMAVLGRVVEVACWVIAAGLPLAAHHRWRTTQRAMRRDEDLPRSRLVPVLAVCVGSLAVASMFALYLP